MNGRMKRGQIWPVSLDSPSGQEQEGRRPVQIVLPETFNPITRVPVVAPITSGGNFARMAGFAVALTGAGTKTTGIVRCDQPRALDLAARGGKRLESIPDAAMNEVLARISPIFRVNGLHSQPLLNLPRNPCRNRQHLLL